MHACLYVYICLLACMCNLGTIDKGEEHKLRPQQHARTRDDLIRGEASEGSKDDQQSEQAAGGGCGGVRGGGEAGQRHG